MWSSRLRPALTVTLLVASVALLASACDRGEPSPDKAPTRVRTGPLAGGGNVPDTRSAGDVVPTWTLPPGVGTGGTVPPGGVRPSVTSGLPGDGPLSAPVGSIPEPSQRPIRAVDEAGPPATDPDIVRLAESVQPARLASSVRRLVSFGSRHADSETGSSTRGVGAARAWLHEELSSLNGQGGRQVLVEFDDFEVGGDADRVTHRNVVATLPGIGRAKRVVYVTAHYDSRVQDVGDNTSDAPGADDDASGVATLLEMCRVLSTRQWDATIRFVAFTAKETGLHGSRHHAAAADRLGIPLLGVFNNDIVGSSRGPGEVSDASFVRVYSAETKSGSSRGLARYLHTIGARYGELDVRIVDEPDRPGREGDHLSFSDAGFAAVRLVEGLEDPTRQHNARDTADRLDSSYHAAVVRLNLVAVANLALAPDAPPAPTRAASADRPDSVLVRWDRAASTGASVPVAGYFVAVRRSGQTRYDRVDWVGDVDEHVLAGVVPEDTIVSVAASDDMGHTSLFSPEAAP